jgi:serine/threonine protein phosphatase PrpC
MAALDFKMIEETPQVIIEYSSTTLGPNIQLLSSCDFSIRSDINAGSRGPIERENQDSFYFAKLSLNEEKILISIVADGHGIHGRNSSVIVVEDLPKIIIPRIHEIIEDPSLLNKIFIDFNEYLSTKLVQMFSDKLIGGTTVILVIEGDGFKISANLADCEAFTLIETDPSNIRMTRDGIDIPVMSNTIQLTVSHGPHLLSEVKRLLDMGASIKFASSDPIVDCKDAYTVENKDGITTYNAVHHTSQFGSYYNNVNNTVALYVHMGGFTFNMSASFGNIGCPFMKRIPTVTVVTFPKGTHTKLIVGSDGYFNCFKTAEINEQLTLTPDMICTSAHAKVGLTFGYANSDNMTVIATIMP